MSDIRNPNEPLRDPRDPLRSNDLPRRELRNLPPDDSLSGDAAWGWIAAAVFVAAVLFVAFAGARVPTQTAENAPPAMSRAAPPAAMQPRTGPALPVGPAPPTTPPDGPQ